MPFPQEAGIDPGLLHAWSTARNRTMLRINQGLLIRSGLLVFGLCTGLFVLHEIQSDRIPNALNWQAEKAIESGRIDKAISYIQRYLEFRPNDSESVMRLAKLIESKEHGGNERNRLLFLYERVLRETPGHEDARRKLIDICLKLNRFSDALLHSQPLLEQTPDDPLLLSQVAEAQLGLSQFPEAAVTLEQAIQKRPDYLRSYGQLATLYLEELNRPSDLKSLLHQMVLNNPVNAEAYLIRARMLKNQATRAETSQDLNRVLEFSPQNAEAMLLRAEIEQGNGDLNRARKSLTDGLTAHPNEARFYRALAWLEASSGNSNTALATLEAGIQKLPGIAELITPLADLYLEQGKPARAEELLAELKGQEKSSNQALYIHARLLLHKQKWGEAAVELEKLRTEAVDLPALTVQLNMLLATCQEKLGQREEQFESLQRALAVDPASLPARIARGNLFWTVGKLDEGIRDLAVAFKSPNCGVGTAGTYGRLLIAQAKSGRESISRWQTVDGFISEFAKRFPQAIEPVLLQAEVLTAKKQLGEAIELVRSETKKRPNQPLIWTVLAQLTERKAGYRKALEVLDEANLAAGDSAALRLARIRHAASDPILLKAILKEPAEKQCASLPDQDRISYLNGLADWYAGIGKNDQLLLILKQLVKKQNRDLPLIRMALSVAYQTNDAATIQDFEEMLRRLEGNDTWTIKALQYQHALQKNTFKSEELNTWRDQVRGWLKTSSERADFHALLAAIEEKRGDRIAAIKSIDIAVQLDRSNLMYLKDRTRLAAQAETNSGFESYTKQLAVDPRIDANRLVQIVQLAFTDEKDPKQIVKLNAIRPFVEDVPSATISLVRFLASKGEEVDARQWLVNAIQKTNHPDLYAANLSLLVQSKDQSGITLALKEAREKLTPNDYYQVVVSRMAEIQTVISSWQPEVKTLADRKLYLETIFNQMVLRGQFIEAKQFLEQIAANGKGSDDEKRWLNRSQTILAVMRGNHQAEPSRLIQVSAFSEEQTTPADMRAKLSVLMISVRQLTGVDRKRVLENASELADKLVLTKDVTLSDRIQSARLHQILGKDDTFEQDLNALLREQPNHRMILAMAADFWISKKKSKAMEEILPRLMQAHDESNCLLLASRFLAQNRPPQELLNWLSQLIEEAPNSQEGMRNAARILNQLSLDASAKAAQTFQEEALRLWKKLAVESPQHQVEVIGTLAMLNRIDEAIEEAELRTSALNPIQRLEAVARILRNAEVTSRQRETLQKIVWTENRKDPESVGVQLMTGEIAMLCNDLATAEKLYRRVLESDPDQVVAKNNLAWVLAPRSEKATEALQLIEGAIRQLGVSAELLDTRARIYLSMGNDTLAESDLTDAIQQQNTSLRRFHQSLLYHKQGNQGKAVTAFEQARKLGLTSRMIHPSDLDFFLEMSRTNSTQLSE
jgi:cellulose synthase operon protein C